MTSTMESTTATTRTPPPSLRRFAAHHKRLTFGGLAVFVLLTAVVVFATLGARISHISDSTSCSGWSAATQAQQAAYATLYVSEHGPLSGGVRGVAGIEQAINSGCIQAYSFDEADSISVLQAIRGQY